MKHVSQTLMCTMFFDLGLDFNEVYLVAIFLYNNGEKTCIEISWEEENATCTSR